MQYRQLRRMFLTALLAAPLAVFGGGCSNPDDPKLVEAPPFTPPPEPEKEKSPGKPSGYGGDPRYQKAMEAQGARSQGS